MRFTVKAILAMAVAIMIPGCGSLASLTDDQLAADIGGKAKSSVVTGLAVGIEFSPANKAAILKDAAAVEASIKADLLPWFTNTPLAQITTQTAQDIMTKLEGQIPGNIALVIGAAITIITTDIPFPANPASGIDPRTQKAMLAGLNGVIAGIDQVMAASSAPPTARAKKKILLVTQK